MPDTARTISAVLALLADNTKGDISPQDVRDSVMSLFPDYAFAPNQTDDFNGVISTTPVLVNTALVVQAGRNFDILDTYKLRYIGAAKRAVVLFANLAGHLGAELSRGIDFEFVKNGTPVVAGHQRVTSPNVAGAEFIVCVQCITEMVTNDTIQIQTALSQAPNATLSLQGFSIIAVALPVLS